MTAELKPLTVSPDTAAGLLDCSRYHVYKLIRQGHLSTFKSGSRVLVEYQGLLDYLESIRRSA